MNELPVLINDDNIILFIMSDGDIFWLKNLSIFKLFFLFKKNFYCLNYKFFTKIDSEKNHNYRKTIAHLIYSICHHNLLEDIVVHMHNINNWQLTLLISVGAQTQVVVPPPLH